MTNFVNWLDRFFKGFIEALFGNEMPVYKDEVEVEVAPEPVPNVRDQILKASKKYLGTDASPQDLVDDALGCVESLCRVLQDVYPNFPVYVATWLFKPFLDKDPRFEATMELEPGNIILSPTGTGNGTIRGHVGIIGENGVIYSNNSFTGKWDDVYTVSSWVHRYRTLGKLRIYVYRPVDLLKTKV